MVRLLAVVKWEDRGADNTDGALLTAMLNTQSYNAKILTSSWRELSEYRVAKTTKTTKLRGTGVPVEFRHESDLANRSSSSQVYLRVTWWDFYCCKVTCSQLSDWRSSKRCWLWCWSYNEKNKLLHKIAMISTWLFLNKIRQTTGEIMKNWSLTLLTSSARVFKSLRLSNIVRCLRLQDNPTSNDERMEAHTTMLERFWPWSWTNKSTGQKRCRKLQFFLAQLLSAS